MKVNINAHGLKKFIDAFDHFFLNQASSYEAIFMVNWTTAGGPCRNGVQFFIINGPGLLLLLQLLRANFHARQPTLIMAWRASLRRYTLRAAWLLPKGRGGVCVLCVRACISLSQVR